MRETPPHILQRIQKAADEKATKLDLSNERLTHIPEEVYALTQLETLNLNGNYIHLVSEQIRELKNLTKIDLRNNDLLQSVPDVYGLVLDVRVFKLNEAQLTTENVIGFRCRHSGDLIAIKSFRYLASLDLGHNQLTELPEWIVKLTNLTSLDLDGNQLTELPEEIAKLTNLTSLNLNYNQLTELPEEIVKLTNLTSLDLRSNKLTKLPEEIAKLTNLTSLYLGGNNLTELQKATTKLSNLNSLDLNPNKLTKLPKWIAKFSKLTSLSIRLNKLTELPEWIAKLSSLTSLDFLLNDLMELPEEMAKLSNLTFLSLGHNKIAELPEWIVKLSNLTSLDLGSNKLTKLPEGIAKLSNLTSLNLGYLRYKLTELPEGIVKLSNLTSLNLCGNKLTELPEGVVKLSNLTYLNLYNNELTELPEGMANLSNLTYLSLGHNQLAELPEEIVKLSNLTSLNLNKNQLTELSEEIAKLSNLTYLNLGHNKIAELPEGIAKLSNLTSLDLKNNQLTELPEWMAKLTNLTSLDLKNNQLTELPEWIVKLTNLTSLDLDGNPITSPPSETVARGIEAMRSYFKARASAESMDTIYEAKLIIVGEPGAGKTTLVEKLLNPAYVIEPNLKSTEGIDVHEWGCKIHGDKPFRTNIWDFGGQQIYHATHQFFLTKRSLYLLIVDTRKQETDFDYWLNAINLLSDSSPVLIVKNEKQNRTWDLDENMLRGRFNNLKETCAINLKGNRGLPKLINRIEHYLGDLPQVGTELPVSWIDVRRALEEKKEENTISKDAFLDLCTTKGFTDTKDALVLSSYLHDLGTTLHFQEDDVLENIVILNPEWGTDAAYAVLDNKAIKEKLGRFNKSDLDHIWSEASYEGKQGALLRLMVNFKLCYEIPGQKDNFIAPQLLSISRVKYIWHTEDNLQFRYAYPDFMPKGLITRFIVAVHRLIEEQTVVWRSGVVLEKRGARAEIIEDYAARKILIRLDGKNRRDLIAIIRNEFETIHDSFHQRLNFEEHIPCNCNTCSSLSEPNFFKLDVLERYIKNLQETIMCDRDFENVNVKDLLRDLIDLRVDEQDPDRAFDRMPMDGAEKPSRRASAKQPITPEAFLSYAWGGKSEEVVDKIDGAFRNAGITLVRDKRDLGFKEVISKFMQKIGRGHCVVVVISKKYLESENCMFELAEISKNGHFKDRIVPIVLENAGIYDSLNIADYLIYWEEKRDGLSDKLKKLKSSQHTETLQEKVSLYDRIRDTIAALTTTLADMNTFNLEMHEAEKFDTLIQKVIDQLKA